VIPVVLFVDLALAETTPAAKASIFSASLTVRVGDKGPGGHVLFAPRAIPFAAIIPPYARIDPSSKPPSLGVIPGPLPLRFQVLMIPPAAVSFERLPAGIGQSVDTGLVGAEGFHRVVSATTTAPMFALIVVQHDSFRHTC
jgi:hypothetical protein